MEMSKVAQCDVTECAYNVGKACHALAITVGDSTDPCCDTFLESSMKGGDMNAAAGVGACKVSSCKFNMKLECQARSIQIGHREDHVDCLTFQKR